MILTKTITQLQESKTGSIRLPGLGHMLVSIAAQRDRFQEGIEQGIHPFE